VLLVHHTGKDLSQRGTSRKEDVLDTSMALQWPSGYDASQGLRFEVHIKKARGFFGDDAKSFEASYSDGSWSRGEITIDKSDETVRSLLAKGKSYRAIEEMTGVSKSAIGRLSKTVH
jgi:putative DNA primase/helicase